MDNRHAHRRIWLAAALSPLAAPLVVAAVVLVLPAVPLTRVGPQPAWVRLAEAARFALLAIPVAYLAMVVLGLPLYLRYLRPREWDTLAGCTLFGACVGGAPPWLLAALLILWQGNATDVHAVAVVYASGICAVSGLVVGATFWRLTATGLRNRRNFTG